VSRILLIDDDVQVNEVVRATLEMLGHTVSVVEHPEAVEAAFCDFQPEITLVDYMLPGCSGLDILRDLSSRHPGVIGYLATGMADFSLLKQALATGAFSMLSKPYRLADIAGLIESARLLDCALRAEAEPETFGSELTIPCAANPLVPPAAIARLVAFARDRGADSDVAGRRLPLIASELMKNAATHGASSCEPAYVVGLNDSGADFILKIADYGPGFDWQRALARARTGFDSARATGLQLALALGQGLEYHDSGRTAIIWIPKSCRDTQV
jgi:CheY-like chemotaxis protein